jgi:hypothetical protein
MEWNKINILSWYYFFLKIKKKMINYKLVEVAYKMHYKLAGKKTCI